MTDQPYRHPYRCLACDGRGVVVRSYLNRATIKREIVRWACSRCCGTGIVYAASDRPQEEQVHDDT